MKRLAALVACCALWAGSQELPRTVPSPYKDGRRTPTTFEGPGRETPEPEHVREVLIGYYGPADESHPEGGLLWQGATLAIEEANRGGGYKGLPFRLVAAWSENPWRAGAALITRMAVVDRVWAIVGSIEGAGTHLAEQVAVKALLSLVNPAATDRSIHMAGVPWMFSIVPGDDMHSAVLARALHGRTLVLLSATDHDSRAFCAYLKAACARENTKLRLQLEFEPGRPDLSELARHAAEARPDAIAVVAGARDSARLVKLLRDEAFPGLIAGSPRFGRAAFAAQAGAAAEGALFPWAGEPAPAFRRSFAGRFGNQPDYAAAGAYDAVRVVVAAIRQAGLNRARIRDAIAALPAGAGASGPIEWDEFGQNRRPPALAVIRSGQPLAAPAR